MAHKVLVVDDEENMRHMLEVLLTEEGYEVDTAADGKAGLEKLLAVPFDFALCDMRMPKMDGPSLLAAVIDKGLPTTMIMMSAYGAIDDAIATIKRGAYDYIPKPFRADEVIFTLKKAAERERLSRENKFLRRAFKSESAIDNIITHNPKMLETLEIVRKVACYKSTVLITGESGTGKELIARAIHQLSDRLGQPFVPVNCGAIPEALLESELFGHVKGAFTDASFTKRGLFEEADGGSIFLDEIGELPLMLQVKLLRVLEDEEIRKVGDTRQAKVNVRVIASTLRNLVEEVKAKRFRSDLFYRLNVLTIHLPPLRERKEDIPILVDAFIVRFNQRLGRSIKSVSPEVMDLLMAANWEGNIRELENALERSMALADSDLLTVDNLPPYLRQRQDEGSFSIPDGEMSIKKVVRQVEEMLIRRALAKTKGNRTKAAKILQISHRALLYKIKDYGLEK